MPIRLICFFLILPLLYSCLPSKSGKENRVYTVNVNNDTNSVADSRDNFSAKIAAAALNAALPDSMTEAILAKRQVFTADLLTCLEGDPHLRELVDKHHSLPQDYVPSDLVSLTEGSVYRLNRTGMSLRIAAYNSLGEMASASRADGVILVAASAYRSYQYQEEVYNRIVQQLGQEAADRESAKPWHSQHQTGLALDFGPIDDSFAQTAAGGWVLKNASRFGWSISFPNGYEALTGYRWESWHYRYVGRELAAFIDNYFNGIQQYALQFLHEWDLLQKNN